MAHLCEPEFPLFPRGFKLLHKHKSQIHKKNSNRTTVPFYTDLKIPMSLSITIFTSKYGSQKPGA